MRRWRLGDPAEVEVDVDVDDAVEV